MSVALSVLLFYTFKMTDSGAVVKATKRCFDWLEIKQHDKQEDCWLVLEGKVYNVTRWAHHHPGGRLILSYHAGRDATVCTFITRDHLKQYVNLEVENHGSFTVYDPLNKVFCIQQDV